MITGKLMNNPGKLLLIDGIGALVTALLLVLIRNVFNSYFAMPEAVLNMLAGIAFCFSLFSLCSYVFARASSRSCLHIISIANLLYCCLTLGLLVYHYQQVTALAIAYFLGEAVVIGGLVVMERKALAIPSIDPAENSDRAIEQI
jgi:cytosine/uracil/thiamine/allantoin permease